MNFDLRMMNNKRQIALQMGNSHNLVSGSRSGQAMVEFIVGLVAMLALFAGLLQVASLTRAHNDTMIEARREAGEKAMGMGVGVGSDYPDYIENWEEGSDELRYTADDVFSTADAFAFTDIIVENAAKNGDDWGIINEIPNDISMLHDNVDPSSFFGLVKGESEQRVELISAVQSLLYGADSINIKSEVWMTWTKGIY